MSNSLLKKVTAAVALTAIVSSTIGSVSSTYASTAELEAAAKLADSGVITTASDYRLGDTITRREMLKVMVNLSKLTVENKCEGKFTDLPATDWGCKYAEAALAAGYIAANAKFRPNDNVSKAEAVKMVMKAKGLEKDATAGLSWEAAYVKAAVAAKLVDTAFTDYSTASKRGFTIVTAANAIDSEDDLGLDDLLDGTDTTVSTGTTSTGTTTSTDTTVKAGDLSIDLNPSSATSGTSVPMAGIVKFASVDFTAGSSDVVLNSVEVKKAGLSTVSSSTKVWFEKNGLRISGKASMTSDGNAVVSFAPAYVVKASSTETLDLYVQLADSSAGTDYQFVSGNFATSAANVSGSFQTPVLRTANYTVATFQARTTSSPSSYKASNDIVELGAFTVAATKSTSVTETRDEQFKSITVYQNEGANLTNLENITLVRNGTVVSTSASVDGKALTFTVNDTIKDGATATYYVKAKIINVENSIDKYQFYLKNTSDVNIVEASSGFRVNAESDSTDKFTSNVYSVNGWDVKFDRDSSVALSQTYAPGSSNVVLMAGTITAKNAITLEDPELTISSITTGNLSNYFNTIYLQVGNSVLSATATGITSSKIQFNGSATISGTATVKLYGTLKSTTGMAGTTIKFADLMLVDFKGTKEYTANQNTVTSAVGSIAGITVTVSRTALTATRNDGLGATSLASGSKGITVLGTQLSSTQGNPVTVTSATYVFTGSNTSTSTGHLNNAYATLYVDGSAVVSKTVDTTDAIKFDGFTTTVSTTKSVNLVVKVDFNSSFVSGDFKASLTSVSATDSVSSASLNVSTINGALFTIATAGATLAVSDVNPQASLFLAGSASNKVFGFKVTAKNDSINLKTVTLSGTKLDSFANYKLYDTNGNLVATSSAESANQVTFENIDSSKAPVVQDKSVSFYVSADANTNTTTTWTKLTLSSLVIRGSNGSEITSGTSGFTYTADSVVSNLHAVAENTAVFAKATNSSKELTTSALRFTVTANGKNNVTLAGLTLAGKLSGYDVSTASVKVYKDSISSSNLAFTGTVDGSGNVVGATATSNNKNTVDAGSTVTYIVAIEGAVWASNSNTLDWNVKLSDVDLGNSISAATYNNLGSFPITETK